MNQFLSRAALSLSLLLLAGACRSDKAGSDSTGTDPAQAASSQDGGQGASTGNRVIAPPPVVPSALVDAGIDTRLLSSRPVVTVVRFHLNPNAGTPVEPLYVKCDQTVSGPSGGVELPYDRDCETHEMKIEYESGNIFVAKVRGTTMRFIGSGNDSQWTNAVYPKVTITSGAADEVKLKVERGGATMDFILRNADL